MNFSKTFAILSLACLPTLSWADDAGMITAAKGCSTLSDQAAKLSCYDTLFAPRPDATEESSASNWKTFSEKSNMTDQTSAWIITESKEPVSCRDYQAPTKLNLLVACFENETSITIGSNGCFFADSSGYGKVEYRIDGAKLKSAKLDAANDNSSLGAWGGKAIPLIKELSAGSKVIYRLTPFNRDSIEAEFDLTGLEDQLKPLRKECGW